MSLQKGHAIVLKKFRSGEKDLVAQLLFDSGEKRPLRLHGILSSKNRSPLLAEPGCLIELNSYDSGKEELSLREGTVLKRYDSLKTNYQNQELLSRILILGNLASSGAPDPASFILLKSALDFADGLVSQTTERHQYEAFLLFLCVRTLSLMGLLGDTGHCAQCERPLHERALFGDGGFFLCEQCNSLADSTGFLCSQELMRMQHHRYRTIRSHVEGLDAAVFQQLKNGLQRALRFTVPDPPDIFG